MAGRSGCRGSIGVSRAMDMVLTGRAVSAREAFDMGLVNRVVPDGCELAAAAEELARELAAFPQTCLREDRLSLLEQDGLDEPAALANEFGHGLRSLADVAGGARALPVGRGPPRRVRLGVVEKPADMSRVSRPVWLPWRAVAEG